MIHKYGLVSPKVDVKINGKKTLYTLLKGKRVKIHAPTEDISGNASF